MTFLDLYTNVWPYFFKIHITETEDGIYMYICKLYTSTCVHLCIFKINGCSS